MKRKTLASLLLVACIILQLSTPMAAHALTPEGFEGGSGTESAPWQIKTQAQLAKVRSYLSNHFILVADIPLTGTWVPIGYNASNAFTGTFKGQNFSVTGLYADYNVTASSTTPNNVGLFGYTKGARIYDLKVSGSQVKGGSYVGSIVGYGAGLLILQNCHSSVNVNAGTNSGGLVGYAPDDARISNCSYSGNVVGKAQTGGIVGYAKRESSEPVITQCKVTGTVNGLSEVGGIAGQVYGHITQCSSHGNVTGSGSYVGGIVGYLGGNSNVGGTVVNSYSRGVIKGDSYTGGIAGKTYELSNTGSTYVRYSYATGEVSATGSYTGGIIGYIPANYSSASYTVAAMENINQGSSTAARIQTIIGANFGGSNNLYNSKVTIKAGGNAVTPSQATAKTLAQLNQMSTYAEIGWDIGIGNQIWGMGADGYPFLKYDETPITVSPDTVYLNLDKKTAQLTATPQGTSVTWKSDNTSIVTVDSNGNLTGVASGETTVRATSASGNSSSSCLVKVDFTVPALNLRVNLQRGDTLSLAGFYASGVQKLTWVSSNTNVASVDATGQVLALSPGLTTITGTDAYKQGVSLQIQVIDVVPVTGITLETTGLNLEIGQTHPVEYEITPVNATNQKVIWISSHPNVAKVEDGAITALASGTAVVTAVTADGQHTVSITVTVDSPLTDMVLSPESPTIIIGDTLSMSAATLEGSPVTDVIWTSADENIASVDPDTGLVSGLSAGDTVITAAAGNGVSARTTVTVRALIVETLAAWTAVPQTGPYTPTTAYTEDFKAFGRFTGEGVTMQYGASSSEFRATGWTFAASNVRAWQAEFKTEGFKNIRVNSIQTANNKSPNNFILEYSIDGRTWQPAAVDYDEGGSPVYEYYIRQAADKGATTKELKDILLPDECNDQARVLVRWRSVNDQGPNDAVADTAPAIIKTIIMTGEH